MIDEFTTEMHAEMFKSNVVRVIGFDSWSVFFKFYGKLLDA